MSGIDDIRAQFSVVADPMALLQGLFAALPVGLQIYRPDGHPLLVNQAFLDLFGSQPPPEYNVLNDEIAERAGTLSLIRRAFAGETVRMPRIWYDPRELTQVHVGGKRVGIEATCFPLFERDGKTIEYVVVVFKDVTAEMRDREAAEEERDLQAAARQRLGSLLKQAPVPIAVYRGAEHVYDLVNPLYAQIFGAQGLLIGKRVRDAMPEIAARGLVAILDQIYATGEPCTAHQLHVQVDRQQRGTLEDAWFNFVVEPTRDERGAIDGLIVAGADVTDLVIAARLKDEFLSIVSHELRTPLTPILMGVRLLQSNRADPATMQRALAAIERNGKALARLIEDLLDVSRIIRGRLKLAPKPASPADAVLRAIEVARPAADGRDIEIVHDLQCDLGEMFLDPDRLQQVAWNLVSNAIKFSENGTHVFVSLRMEALQLVLSVSDEGRGILGDMLPFVFERFRQQDSTTTRRFGGMGLGLAIVKHIVELHGGTVEAKSPGENRGALFTVWLPVRRP